MALVKIESLLARSLKKRGIKNQIDSVLALERAQSIMEKLLGPEVAPTARPAYIQYKSLTVCCLNGAVAERLGLYQNEIISYVNEGFSQRLVERIRVIR